jgi:uncharacterized membrane protein (UPF0127 family)
MLKNAWQQLKTNPVYQAIAVGGAVLFAICGLIFATQQSEQFITPLPLQQVTYQARSGAQYSLLAEVARTAEDRYQGLRFRTSLGANSGMLFVFPTSEVQTFTMQDTYVSLDIIFLDANQNVITIYERTATNQTDILYSSILPAKYVVEAPAGWVDRVGLQTGHFISIQ